MTLTTQLQRLRAFACNKPQLVKRGDLGGQGNDQPFEQAFSSIAHSYLRDKAPSLLDHEQGFQLLDRNDDNTKAVGIIGFKVGSNQLYAPVFFLQGDLKGHELLYLKNQDLFVPLKENWLNYILNRKPNILGEGVDRNTANFGVRPPELNRLAMSPNKFASAVAPWCREVMPKIAATALTDVRAELTALGSALNLPTFIKQASLPVLETLVEFFTEHPRIAQAYDRFHGLSTLSDAVKAAGLRARAGNSALGGQEKRAAPAAPKYRGSVLDPAPIEHPIKTGELKIITYDATQETDLPTGLTEEDQEKLLKEKMLVKDRRTEEKVSVPYDVQVEKKLFNPTETGLYFVLVKPGKFEKCFIAMAPHGAAGRKTFATLVRIDGEKDWCNAHPTKIWCCSRVEGPDYDKWLEGLKTPDSLSKGESRYVLIGQRGAATLPFRVKNSLGDAEGDSSYEVDFSDWCSSGLDKYQANSFRTCCSIDDNDYESWRDGARVHLNGKDGTSMRSHRGDLWIPKGAKLLTIEASEGDTVDDDKPHATNEDAHSKKEPLRPGDYVDAELGVIMKTKPLDGREPSHAETSEKKAFVLGEPRDAERAITGATHLLKLHWDGSEFSINGKQASAPLGTLIQLIRDHGFREETARELMKRAAAQHVLRCRVKYANPYLTQDGPTAPSIPDPPYGENNIMGSTAPTQSPFEQNIKIPGMSASLTDRSIYNPNPQFVGDPMSQGPGSKGMSSDADKIQQAAQTGQKEIFDTATIGSLLKSTRDDTMINKQLPDLLKALNALGKLLFFFYWNGDRFADRYGRQDMPELEDALRNTFEGCGDTYLFLAQKEVTPYPEEQGDSTDLEAAAS